MRTKEMKKIEDLGNRFTYHPLRLCHSSTGIQDIKLIGAVISSFSCCDWQNRT